MLLKIGKINKGVMMNEATIAREVIKDTLGGYIDVQHFDIKELLDKEKYVDPKAMSFFKVERHMEEGKETFTSIPYTLQDVYDTLDAKRTPPEKAGYVCTLLEYREMWQLQLQEDLKAAKAEVAERADNVNRANKRLNSSIAYRTHLEQLIQTNTAKLTSKRTPNIG